MKEFQGIEYKEQLVGYRRVSTILQSTARQLDGVELDVEFEDKASGKDTKRPELQRMIDHVRSGDLVVVHEMSRLGRNLADLKKLVDVFKDKGVGIYFIKERLDFSAGEKANAMTELMFNLMGSLSQFERELMLERQREGIELAKREGKYDGKKSTIDLDKVRELLATDKNKSVIARELGVTRPALYRAIDRIEKMDIEAAKQVA